MIDDTKTARRMPMTGYQDASILASPGTRITGTRRVEEMRQRVNGKLLEFQKAGEYGDGLRGFMDKAQSLLMSPEAKRVRSVIPLLLAEENDLDVDDCLWHGVIIELLHFTSLVHDDVIDNHGMRRGLPTLNREFSNSAAVLTGDYLIYEVISRCLSIANSLKIIDLVINAAKNMVAGVLMEQNVLPSEMSLDNYLEMARRKTGSLFALSFGLPFVADGTLHHALECGHLFGTVFQIYDDFLDRDHDMPHENIFEICSKDQVEKVLAEYTGRFIDIGKRIHIESTLAIVIDFLKEHGYFHDFRGALLSG